MQVGCLALSGYGAVGTHEGLEAQVGGECERCAWALRGWGFCAAGFYEGMAELGRNCGALEPEDVEALMQGVVGLCARRDELVCQACSEDGALCADEGLVSEEAQLPIAERLQASHEQPTERL